MGAPLDLSILEFHQNAKRVEFLKSQKSITTFYFGWNSKILEKNKEFGNDIPKIPKSQILVKK